MIGWLRHIGWVLGLLLILAPAYASAEEAIGYVKTVSGAAYVVRDKRIPARIGEPVLRSDVLETGADGSLGVTFQDNSVFSMGPDSRLAVEEYQFDSSSFEGSFLSELTQGTLTVESGDIARSSPTAMRIKIPDAVLGVRGTFLAIKVAAP